MGGVVHKEPHLLRRLIRRALENLDSKMCSKRHELTCYEAILAAVLRGAQRWSVKQRGQVKRRKGVEDDDLVRSISVDGLVEREVRRRVVVRLV